MLPKLLTLLPLLALTLAAPQDIQKRAVTTISQCTNSGQVALTYDDGPYIYETNIANTLAAAGNSKATFFLNGNNYRCIYDAADDIKALHAAGHTLGSHTWSHADLTTLSWDQIHDELWRVELAFIKILGLKPLYFRPPYGNINDLALAALDNRGYKKVFLWSDDTGDSTGASTGQSQAVYDAVAGSYPNPHLVLEHSTDYETANQLTSYAVNRLRGVGYQLVAVDTCLGSQGEWPYQWVGQPQQRDDTWHC